MALVALTDESITVANTAIGITATEIGDEVVMAVCRLETAQIRYNPVQDPTSGGAEGSPLMNVDDELEVWGQPDLRSIRFIRTGSTSGALRVILYGTGKT